MHVIEQQNVGQFSMMRSVHIMTPPLPLKKAPSQVSAYIYPGTEMGRRVKQVYHNNNTIMEDAGFEPGYCISYYKFIHGS